MKNLEKFVEEIKKQHGSDLKLKDDVYYLFVKDGVIAIYYNEDEKSIKVDVEFLPEENTFVYFNKNLSLGELL